MLKLGRIIWFILLYVLKIDYSKLPRPHCLLFKASSHQETIPHIFLEIPEVGRVCCILLLLLLLLGLRQETHPSFYKRKTHDLQVICSGRTFSISLWYKRKVCIRSLSKIRLEKHIGMYVTFRGKNRQKQSHKCQLLMFTSLQSDWWLSNIEVNLKDIKWNPQKSPRCGIVWRWLAFQCLWERLLSFSHQLLLHSLPFYHQPTPCMMGMSASI